MTATPTPASTASGPTPTPTADGFQCYETARTLFTRFTVSLDDRFGPSTVEVIRPHRLCNPANVNGADPTAPDDPEHLVGYIIRQTVPRFAKVTNQVVTDQFGSLTVDLVKPDYLTVPSAKSMTSPPPPLVDPTLNHFKCYRVNHGIRRVPLVTIDDEFGSLRLMVRKPFRLCIPADKNGEGINDPQIPLMCYVVKPAIGEPPFKSSVAPVYVNNQFGQSTHRVDHRRELCVPATLGGP